jgi:hypothetical protein
MTQPSSEPRPEPGDGRSDAGPVDPTTGASGTVEEHQEAEARPDDAQGGIPTHSSSQPNDDSRAASHPIRDLGVLVTVLGLTSYALARVTIDAFLGPFNLAFSDVGLQYSDIVASGALLTVVTAGVVLPAYVVANSRWKRALPRLIRVLPESVYDILLSIAIFCILLALSFGFAWITRPTSEGATPFESVAPIVNVFLLIVASGLGILVMVASFVTIRRRLNELGTPDTGHPYSGNHMMQYAGGLAAAVIVLVPLLVFCHLKGTQYANQALRGERVSVDILGVHLPGIRARPVYLFAPAGSEPLGAQCYLLLGQSEGFVVLYDPRAKQIDRHSIDPVSITESLTQTACPRKSPSGEGAIR